LLFAESELDEDFDASKLDEEEKKAREERIERKRKKKEQKRQAKEASFEMPPLLTKITHDNVQVLGFTARQRKSFLDAIMCFGMPPENAYHSQWSVGQLNMAFVQCFLVGWCETYAVSPSASSKPTCRSSCATCVSRFPRMPTRLPMGFLVKGCRDITCSLASASLRSFARRWVFLFPLVAVG
jgi:hypothetical protein